MSMISDNQALDYHAGLFKCGNGQSFSRAKIGLNCYFAGETTVSTNSTVFYTVYPIFATNTVSISCGIRTE